MIFRTQSTWGRSQTQLSPPLLQPRCLYLLAQAHPSPQTEGGIPPANLGTQWRWRHFSTSLCLFLKATQTSGTGLTFLNLAVQESMWSSSCRFIVTRAQTYWKSIIIMVKSKEFLGTKIISDTNYATRFKSRVPKFVYDCWLHHDFYSSLNTTLLLFICRTKAFQKSKIIFKLSVLLR